MINGNLTCVLRHLHSLCDVQAAKDLTDAQLLERFRARGEDSAFAILVQRHGPMVLAASRRVLNQEHDADDVFQATFLVLARKARSIRKQASLASWLYGVAYRIARKAAATRARRRAHESRTDAMPSSNPLDAMSAHELRTALDEEINQLPEKYRAPMVLCYFEGKTQEQAALELGCPKSSLGSRIGRARQLLHTRLTRRGIGLSAGALAAVLANEASTAAVPALLAINTVRAAALAAAGKTLTAAVASTKVCALAEGALEAMSISKLQIGAIFFLATSILVVAAGLFAQQAAGEKLPIAEQRGDPPQNKPDTPAAKAQAGRADLFGDPLPAGAVLRLGTLRLRHKEGIASVAFAPNSRAVISGGGDATIRLWDVDTGREVRKLDGHEGTAVALAVSRDGKLLAAATVKTIHLWDLSSGKLLEKIPADTTRPIENGVSFLGKVPLAFALDGGLLAFVTAEPSIRVWDVAARKERLSLKGHAKPAEVLGFSADSKTLISASGDRSGDGQVRFWDTVSGEQRRSLHLPLQLARSSAPFAISADGRTLALEGLEEIRRPVAGGVQVSTGFKIRLWDLETLEERMAMSAQSEVIWSATFAPDGKTIAAALMGGQLVVWDAATGKELQRCSGFPEGTRPDGGQTLAFSQDGKMLAAVGSSAALTLWNVASGRPAFASADAHHSGIAVVAFSPDGRNIATAGGDHTIRLWDRATGRHRLQLSGHKGGVRALVFARDGRTLASASSDGAIRVWDAAAGRELLTLQAVERTAGMYFGICPIAFTADGTGLVSWGDDRRFRLWNVADGKMRSAQTADLSGKQFAPPGRPEAIPPLGKRVLGATFTADGRIAALAFQEAICIVDVATGAEILRMAGHPHLTSLAFSPDGKNLLTGGWDKVLRLWDTTTGQEILKAERLDHINAVAVATDGRTAAAAAGWADGTIYLLDAVTGTMLDQLKGHETYVGALAFSRDGKSLASGQRDTTALVWDADAILNRPRAAKVNDKDLADLWNDLAGTDARKAHAAVWKLAGGGAAVVSFLQQRLPPAPHTNAKHIQKLIADLDSPQFALRESAKKELANLGSEAHSALREAMKGDLSAEARRRVEYLLSMPFPRGVPAGDALRQSRAVSVLEHHDSPAAASILESLAKGAPSARVTQEAKRAIERKRS